MGQLQLAITWYKNRHTGEQLQWTWKPKCADHNGQQIRVSASHTCMENIVREKFAELKSGATFPPKHQAPVVQTMDSAIRRINHYPVDK